MAMTHKTYRKLHNKLDAVASTKKPQPDNTAALNDLLDQMFSQSGESDDDGIFGPDAG